MFRPSDEITPDDGTDGRTRAQKMHDALATVLTVAASSRLLPTIGGAAPTLVVSVRAEDLLTQNGWAHVEGADEPVSRAAAQHAGCAGVIQRVMLGHNGRIRKIGTEERIFNRHQRRAIALRDGGCIIPGCGVPAGWCEIHHVTEHSRGGPTHTDNGASSKDARRSRSSADTPSFRVALTQAQEEKSWKSTVSTMFTG
jgi:hypothetical protein